MLILHARVCHDFHYRSPRRIKPATWTEQQEHLRHNLGTLYGDLVRPWVELLGLTMRLYGCAIAQAVGLLYGVLVRQGLCARTWSIYLIVAAAEMADRVEGN